MKGLVLKDLLVLKVAMKTVVPIVLIFGFMGAMSGSAYMTTFASVYAAILPMTSIAYDERCAFNRYAMTMPVKTRDIVLSKYVTGLILAVAALVICIVITAFSGGMYAETILTAILIPMFYHSFMLPVMFKFGVEKSRLIVMVTVVIPALAIGFAEEAGVLDGFITTLASFSPTVLITGLVCVVLAMYIASIFASIAICKNKEW
ncbi:MAG: ABC-2 transporter permease [Ruminococcaceae bacterium]|nr:ABC-2 transporter permease [Oscillospiraceae bacterium]